ncbi:ORF-129 [Catopsilia pomona nucleopolyhedrovirus]|uniref:ORF-129 n=1 Tax=Catopsilia pomona nucleopolyhedrovirus TaxID=1850906 RepID=A0A172WZJ6_9ABAC|nr:ORF-129 [Catopsilia pomona nucleopolyhedrovirus]ANF29777.1 ORF-129 [Catopsilia pomona nucleopolyhedrovirus]
MYRTAATTLTNHNGNAPVVVTTNYDRYQLRRELNSLRSNVHEMCTRSAAITGNTFDCGKFLRNDDYVSSTVTATMDGSGGGNNKIVKTVERKLVDTPTRVREDVTAATANTITTIKYDSNGNKCLF